MRILEKNLREYIDVPLEENTATMTEEVDGMTTEVSFSWEMANYVPMDNEVDVFVKFIDANTFNNDVYKKADLSQNDILKIKLFVQEYIEDNAIDYGLESLIVEQLEIYKF